MAADEKVSAKMRRTQEQNEGMDYSEIIADSEKVERLRQLVTISSPIMDDLKEASIETLKAYYKLKGEVLRLRDLLEIERHENKSKIKKIARDSKIQMKSQSDKYGQERSYLIEISADLTAQKNHSLKLVSVVICRWILELFRDNILLNLAPGVSRFRDSSEVKNAWNLFFQGSSNEQSVRDAFSLITSSIPTNRDIIIEVERIRRTHYGLGSTYNAYDWFVNRSSKLYSIFSDFIHHLPQLGWTADDATLKLIFQHLPWGYQHDKSLVTIVRNAILPFIQSENVD